MQAILALHRGAKWRQALLQLALADEYLALEHGGGDTTEKIVWQELLPSLQSAEVAVAAVK